MATQSYTLYGAALSIPSVKVGLALQMTGTPYNYKHVDVRTGQHKTPEYIAINRYGQVPALTHGETTVVQSDVILEYLGEKTKKFWPKDKAAQYRVKEWLAWEADLCLPGVAMPRALTRFQQGDPMVIEFMRKRGERALGMMEAQLSKTAYLCGAEPTMADIACAVDLSYLDEAGLSLDNFPSVRSWHARMAALPGWKNPKEALPTS
jgi:glutathione S-transferase